MFANLEPRVSRKKTAESTKGNKRQKSLIVKNSSIREKKEEKSRIPTEFRYNKQSHNFASHYLTLIS